MTKSKSKSKKSEKGKEVNNSANAGDSRVSKTCEVFLRIRWKRFLLKPPFCIDFRSQNLRTNEFSKSLVGGKEVKHFVTSIANNMIL